MTKKEERLFFQFSFFFSKYLQRHEKHKEKIYIILYLLDWISNLRAEYSNEDIEEIQKHNYMAS